MTEKSQDINKKGGRSLLFYLYTVFWCIGQNGCRNRRNYIGLQCVIMVQNKMKHHLAGALCPYGSESYLRSVQKNLAKYLAGTKTVFNFAVQTASQKPGQGQAGGSADIIRKRLSALILDVSEFSQNSFRCQGLSNGRCPRICNFSCFRQCISREIWPDALIAYTSVGFCVAVQLRLGNARSL